MMTDHNSLRDRCGTLICSLNRQRGWRFSVQPNCTFSLYARNKTLCCAAALVALEQSGTYPLSPDTEPSFLSTAVMAPAFMPGNL